MGFDCGLRVGYLDMGGEIISRRRVISKNTNPVPLAWPTFHWLVSECARSGSRGVIDFKSRAQ